MIESSWHNLYSEGWRDITRESFSHPAKYSRALIRYIYKHAIEEGWVKPGDVVIDPFGGIGLGGIDAMQYGLHWIGIELEKHFHDMGHGCECTGVSKEDWARYQGRLDRIRYKDGRHICPECLANARAIIEEKPKSKNGNGNGKKKKVLPLPPFQKVSSNMPLMEFESLSTSYKRNSGKTPYTLPHYYKGNIDLWNEKGLPGTATLLQGDSRHLIEVIQKAELNVSSPPYADCLSNPSNEIEKTGNGGPIYPRNYGVTEGQLGSMPEGDYQLSVSSPPFLQQSGGTNVTSETGPLSDPRLIKRHSAGNAAANAYGEDPANLGNMPQGDLFLSSPPYADSIKPNGDGIDWDKVKNEEGKGNRSIGRGAIADGYSNDGHNLENMKDDPEKYNLAISSPPYAETDLGGGGGILTRDEKMRKSHGMVVENENYGSDPGNLGNMKDKGVDLALSSPPYSETRISGNGDEGTTGLRNEDGSYLRGSEGWEKRKELGARYGNSDGNLGNLKDCGLSVSSPPFSEPNNQPCIGQGTREQLYAKGKKPLAQYGNSEGNLGNMDMGVSSPPYEGSLQGNQSGIDWSKIPDGKGGYRDCTIEPGQAIREHMGLGYGDSDHNLGNNNGNDFWSAARIIVEQVYQALKPGGHSIWVLKAYIKGGKIVNFPDQWRLLCESVGFKTVHVHRAWLVEEKGTQYDLFGEAHIKKVERKSFFRRLAERHGSPAINYEIVLCMQKGEL